MHLQQCTAVQQCSSTSLDRRGRGGELAVHGQRRRVEGRRAGGRVVAMQGEPHHVGRPPPQRRQQAPRLGAHLLVLSTAPPPPPKPVASRELPHNLANTRNPSPPGAPLWCPSPYHSQVGAQGPYGGRRHGAQRPACRLVVRDDGARGLEGRTVCAVCGRERVQRLADGALVERAGVSEQRAQPRPHLLGGAARQKVARLCNRRNEHAHGRQLHVGVGLAQPGYLGRRRAIHSVHREVR